jgi:hypothetical protein
MSHQLQVKGLSVEVRERLQASADRNFRSLNQEALARIQFSFDLEDSLRSKHLQALMDEGLAGPARPGSVARLREIAAQARAAVK